MVFGSLNKVHYFIKMDTNDQGYLHLYHHNNIYDESDVRDQPEDVYFEYIYDDEIETRELIEEVNNCKFFAIHHNDYNESKDIAINEFITVKIVRNDYSVQTFLELKGQTIWIRSHQGKDLGKEKRTLTYLIKTRCFDYFGRLDAFAPQLHSQRELHRYRKYRKKEENYTEMERYLEERVRKFDDFSRVRYVYEEEFLVKEKT